MMVGIAIITATVLWISQAHLQGSAIKMASAMPTSSPPVLSKLIDFELANQDGRVMNRKSLLGRVQIINFIFTTCPGVCPLLTNRMKLIEKNTRHLGDKIHFVSISVDPETDQPAVLKAYGEKHEVDFSRWDFLTGSLDSVKEVVVSGFKSAMNKTRVPASDEESPDLMQITHGEHFVIVDPQGQLRAFKTANTMKEVEAIVELASKLQP